MFRHLKVGTHL